MADLRVIDKLRSEASPLRDGLSGWNGMAIELEYAELLYDLVRALRPFTCIETGSGEGRASAFIASALQDNGNGWLYTFEHDTQYSTRAVRTLKGLPATVRHEAWTDADSEADFVFIDSISPYRIPEIEWWLTYGRKATVVIHDANRVYPLHLGTGVLLTRGDGLWIGRAGGT